MLLVPVNGRQSSPPRFTGRRSDTEKGGAASSMMVVVIKGREDANEVDRGRKDDENVEDRMRTAPKVEAARLQGLRYSSLIYKQSAQTSNTNIAATVLFHDIAYRIEKSAEQEAKPFTDVIYDTGLLHHLLEPKELDSMCQRCESRQARTDKGDDAERSPSRTLEPGARHNDSGCEPKRPNLRQMQVSATCEPVDLTSRK